MLLTLGALLVVIGASIAFWPLGLVAAGTLMILAAVDLRR